MTIELAYRPTEVIHVHRWQLRPYERYISVGTCECGKTRYFTDFPQDQECIDRINELNAALGWKNIRLTNANKGVSIEDGERRDNLDPYLRFKEVKVRPPAPKPKSVRVKHVKVVKAAKPVKQSGLTADQLAWIKDHPVPPKPECKRKMRSFYEDNKPAILADLEVLGKREMLARWRIYRSSWNQPGGLADQWGIPVVRYPKRAHKSNPSREVNKEAMIADYRTMETKAFLARWHISGATWKKLKKVWKVEGKYRKEF